LFPIGLILAIRSWKNLTNQVFILYFGISLFPTLLTLPWENPNMLRTCTVIPSIIYFSVLSLKFIKEKVIQYFQSVPVIYVYLFIMMLVMLSALYDLRTYHKYHSMIVYQTFPIMMPLEQAIITDINELRF
jgi:hypothetical protein